jgi:DNA invertase Pin-like site-specific DNA recombinase
MTTVGVHRFDRFARSTNHLLVALEEFRSLGIRFVGCQENIDTSSPLGRRGLLSLRLSRSLSAT